MKRFATARKMLLGLFTVTAGVAIAAVLAASSAGVSQGQRPADLEGSYLVQITVANPPLGTFPDLMTFTDGTVVSTRPQYITASPAGALLESPGHGAYVRGNGCDEFNVRLVNLLQGAPGNALLGGNLFGVENIRWDVKVDERHGTVSGPWSSTVTDPNGNVILALSGTITGSRITAP